MTTLLQYLALQTLEDQINVLHDNFETNVAWAGYDTTLEKLPRTTSDTFVQWKLKPLPYHQQHVVLFVATEPENWNGARLYLSKYDLSQPVFTVCYKNTVTLWRRLSQSPHPSPDPATTDIGAIMKCCGSRRLYDRVRVPENQGFVQETQFDWSSQHQLYFNPVPKPDFHGMLEPLQDQTFPLRGQFTVPQYGHILHLRLQGTTAASEQGGEMKVSPDFRRYLEQAGVGPSQILLYPLPCLDDTKAVEPIFFSSSSNLHLPLFQFTISTSAGPPSQFSYADAINTSAQRRFAQSQKYQEYLGRLNQISESRHVTPTKHAEIRTLLYNLMNQRADDLATQRLGISEETDAPQQQLVRHFWGWAHSTPDHLDRFIDVYQAMRALKTPRIFSPESSFDD